MTGKPIALGGSEGRNEATAQGAVYCVVDAAAHLGMDLTKCTVAVQGFGNAGAIAAQLMARQGSTIIAASDTGGAIYKADGFDPDAGRRLEAGARQRRRVPRVQADHQRRAARARLRHPDPGRAREPDHAGQRRAHQGEDHRRGANGPTTPEADEILYKAGKFVIPDILCNAGGVTVSYFEWVQDLDRDFWTVDQVNAKLHTIMSKAFAATLEMSLKEKVNMRTAAYMLAVKRVADATTVRGLYP